VTQSVDLVPALLTSNFQRLLGFRITEWRSGAATVALEISEQHLNRAGILHGGVLATLVDAAGGFCGNYSDDPREIPASTTLTLVTNFISSAATGQIVARGRRTGGGHRTFFANVEVFSAEETLLATGSGSYQLRSVLSP
jgi:uncharacterized protein (TIGR00369 family)